MAGVAPNLNPTAYDLIYPEAIGRLIANLATLEFALRVALYLMDTPAAERLPLSWRYADLNVGDAMPVSWLTDWRYLSQLIETYNTRQLPAELPGVDPGISDLRNALAHGGITASGTEPLSLVKFGWPRDGSVRVCEKHVMTLQWIGSQTERALAAARAVIIRMHELRGS